MGGPVLLDTLLSGVNYKRRETNLMASTHITEL